MDLSGNQGRMKRRRRGKGGEGKKEEKHLETLKEVSKGLTEAERDSEAPT